MSATSLPGSFQRPDGRSEDLILPQRNCMSQPWGQHDQLESHPHLIQQTVLGSNTTQLEPFPDFASYTTPETAADSEDISRSSIEPPHFDYGLGTTTFPISNLEDGYILDMEFDPLSSYDYNTVEQDSHKLLGSTSQNNHGFASLASRENQLVSPQLTDIASPESCFDGSTGPTEQVRLLGGGPMSRISSQSTNAEPPVSLCQNTPALTGCSAEASPEPVTNPNTSFMENTKPASGYEFQPANSVPNFNSEPVDLALLSTNVNRPVVRVEKYSRGDSPARTEGSVTGQMRKRSRSARSASYLAAPSDFSSVDGIEHDENEDRSLQDSRTGFDPVARTQLPDTVPNFSDQETTARSDAVKGNVEEWLTNVSTADRIANRGARFRRRAQSTGDGIAHTQ